MNTIRHHIHASIQDAIHNYDWKSRIEYVLDDIDIDEIVADAIDEEIGSLTDSIKDCVKELIAEEVADALDELDIDSIVKEVI